MTDPIKFDKVKVSDACRGVGERLYDFMADITDEGARQQFAVLVLMITQETLVPGSVTSSTLGEPEIVTGYKLGLGVAARVNDGMALGIDTDAERQGIAANAAEALRSAAQIMRGEKEHFANWPPDGHARTEALKAETGIE